MIHNVISPDDQGGAPSTPDRATPSRWNRPVPVTLAVALFVAGAFAVYHRIGTRANAELVEFTRNLAGGFLAVGMTADQPGFVLLSNLDQSDVTVSADRYSSVVGGTHTVLHLTTPATEWHKRLRRPLVVIVHQDGSVHANDVNWTLDEVKALNEGVDCAHSIDGKIRRCGAPFADLRDLLSDWPPDRVPDVMHEFLKQYQPHTTAAARLPGLIPNHKP